jgi:hypothetical protein
MKIKYNPEEDRWQLSLFGGCAAGGLLFIPCMAVGGLITETFLGAMCWGILLACGIATIAAILFFLFFSFDVEESNEP